MHARAGFRARALCAIVFAAIAAGAAQASGAALPATLPPATTGLADSAGGLDVEGIVEKVRHHVRWDRGTLTTQDPLYRLRVAPTGGFSITLRDIPPATEAVARAEDVPFDESAVLALDTSSLRLGGHQAFAPGSWEPSLNTASRAVGPAIRERVTAREGSVEWDFLLDAPVGDVEIVADVRAPGAAKAPITDEEPSLRFPFGDGRGVRVGEMIVVDARGRELMRALPQARGSTLRLHVSAHALRGAAFPVVIDPVLSPEYPTSSPLFGEAHGSQAAPVVGGFDGAFLVVWEDARAGGTSDIFGTRVTSAGEILDEAGIPIAATTESEMQPAVAATGAGGSLFVAWRMPDGIYGRFITSGGVANTAFKVTGMSSSLAPAVGTAGTTVLVAWEVSGFGFGDIHAARVSPAGVIDTVAIPIATGSDVQTAAAVAASGSQFLVTWTDYSSDALGNVMGARVNLSGTVLDPSGIAISAAAAKQDRSAIAGGVNQYLVVWQDNRNGASTDIYGTRVSTAGVVSNPTGIVISNATAVQESPAVAWSGTRFMAVWTDFRNGPLPDIYGVALDANGVLQVPSTSGSPVSTASGTQVEPAIAYATPRFLASWTDHRTSNAEIRGTTISAEGTVPSDAERQISRSSNSQATPAAHWNGSRFLVVWEDDRSGSGDIYSARVDGAGALLDGAGIAISTAPGVQRAPDVTWSGSNFFVVWEDLRGGASDIYASRVSTAGAVLDPAGIPVSTATGYQSGPQAASNGDAFFVVWDDPRSGKDRVYGARVSAAGSVLDPSGIQLSFGAEDQSGAALAWNGAHYFAVWSDVTGAQHRIYGVRVSAAGLVLNPAVSIRQGTGLHEPAVASDGSQFLVVWRDQQLNGFDIYGARVAANGSLLDPVAFPVSQASGTQLTPTAAWNGTRFVAAWTDLRSGVSQDIYAARVTPAGAVLDAAGISVAVSTAHEESPDAAGGVLDDVVLTYRRFAAEHPYGANRTFLRFYDDPTNDADAQARALSGNAGTTSGVTRGASKAPGEKQHAGNAGGASIWFKFTPTQTGEMTLATAGSTFDTTLAVYRESGMQDVVSNNDAPGLGTQSRVVFDAFPGTTYLIAVDGYASGGPVPTGIVLLQWTFVPDVTPPDTTIHSTMPSPTTATTASFIFSANESPATFQCRLDAGPWASCLSPTDYASLADGTHTFEVRATDRFGNVDPTPASQSWTVDTTPPTVTITSGPPTYTNEFAHTFTFTSDDPAASFRCRVGGAFQSCTSPKHVAGLPDGNWKFEVFAIDAVGNASTTASYVWNVDRRAPRVAVSQRPSDPSSDTSPTFVFAPDEPISYSGCILDGASSQCTSPVTYSDLVEGQHEWRVVVVDRAGNTGYSVEVVWRIDLTAPVVTIATGPPSLTNQSTASFGFEANEAASGFECRLDGGAWTPCTSPHAYSDLAEGAHSFEARATDIAGNLGGATVRAWTIDLTPPTVAIDSGPTGTVGVKDAVFEFSSADGAIRFECALDAIAPQDCTSPVTFQGLPDGGHSFSVRGIDEAGNLGAFASRAWTIDTVAPETKIVSGPPLITASRLAMFAFEANKVATFECSLDGSPLTKCTSPKAYDLLTHGEHTFVARATDSVGNVDPTPAEWRWFVDLTPPKLDLLRPQPMLYVLDQQVRLEGLMPVIVGRLTVEARAIDEESGISSFNFEIDGVPVDPSQVTHDPATGIYRFEFSRPLPGIYTIGARAVNGVGSFSFVSTQVLAVSP